jgi:hypothetical protein
MFTKRMAQPAPPAMRVPAALPQLSAGRHLDPSEGACVMEYTSVLAGLPWSDRPRCTHPALAELARLVNDAATLAGRDALLPLVPRLVGLSGRDPRVAPMLVRFCADRARRDHPASPLLRLDAAWAQRRLVALAQGGAKARWVALTHRGYQCGPARRAMADAVWLIAQRPSRDTALPALLMTAITLCEQVLGTTTDEPVRTVAAEPALAAVG